jgi:phospholipase/lecithinase/hemolysin
VAVKFEKLGQEAVMKTRRSWGWCAAAALAALVAACGGGSDGGGGQAAAMSAGSCATAATASATAASASASSASAAACGAGGPTSKSRFSSLVSFGDSLSDVGTYAVGSVVAFGGGGKYTINGRETQIWVDDIADELDLPAPCAYETGLDGISAPLDFNVPVMLHAGCTAYAQGGARVTDPIGPGNAALGGDNAVTGWLTVPIVAQIGNHLKAAGGAFRGDEVVLVLAGANDVLINLALVGAGAQTPAQAAAAMAQAATDLTGDVRQLLLANGAKYVVVVNIPDMSAAPRFVSLGAATQGLTTALVTTFNSTLQAGLAGSGVLFVDAYAFSQDQNANPQKYGFTNVTLPACDLAAATNPIHNALMCNTGNLQPGLSLHAAGRYYYADDIHPTPYAHQQLANRVLAAMEARGWL